MLVSGKCLFRPLYEEESRAFSKKTQLVWIQLSFHATAHWKLLQATIKNFKMLLILLGFPACKSTLEQYQVMLLALKCSNVRGKKIGKKVGESKNLGGPLPYTHNPINISFPFLPELRIMGLAGRVTLGHSGDKLKKFCLLWYLFFQLQTALNTVVHFT